MDEAERDALFQLPPAEFVAARQALAARLKAAGRKDGAKAAAALARPKATAYAVNQLRWRSPERLAAITTAAAGVRTALESGGGAALKAALRQRREALDAAVRVAEAALRETGQALSLDASRRICASLDAFAAAPDSVDVGRLVDDLEAPGFDSLAGLAVTAPVCGPLALAEPVVQPAAPSPAADPGSAPEAAAAAALRERQRRRAEAQQRLALREAEADSASRECHAATRAGAALDAEVAELRARLADREQKQRAAQARLDLARECHAAARTAAAAARDELAE